MGKENETGKGEGEGKENEMGKDNEMARIMRGKGGSRFWLSDLRKILLRPRGADSASEREL